jgi:HK97 family phage major capsid protein
MGTPANAAYRQAETVETLGQLLRDAQKMAARDGYHHLDDILARQFGGLKHIDVYESRQKNEELAYKFAQWAFTVFTPPDYEIHIKALRFCRDNGIKALDGQVNVGGGALVPPEFDKLIVRLIENFGVFRANAKVRLMKSDQRTFPRRTGGVTTAWLGQGDGITASQPAYDSINLVAKKLGAITVASSEIDEDSALALADELAFEMGYAFATAEDAAGFVGDGSPTFGGITGIATKLRGLDATIANIAGLKVSAGGNAFSEFLLQDWIDTAALLPAYADNPKTAWYVHRSVYFSAMLRAALLTTAGVPVGGIVSTGADGRPVFLGYPVNFTQAMPKVDANSQIAALLGDLSLACTLGDRRKRAIFIDPYTLSGSDSIQYRGIERVDCVTNDVGNASGTPSARVAGPVVGLISAAT